MSYQFKPSLGVQANLRRVAAGQIANAIAELDDPGLDQAKLVHQLRRRCKKLRGLIRLVAPAMGKAYAVENAHLRDAARRLSSSRDAQVMLETHDALIAPPAAPADAIDFASVRQQLQARLNQSSTTETEEQLSGFRSDMLAMKPRAKEWQVSGKGFSAIACGLQKTHHQATRSLQDAISRPSEESFHQLRKQVKYHGYQLRLLRPLWIDMFVTYEQLCSALSELLGDDHNLQVLRSTVLETAQGFGGQDSLKPYLRLLDTRSKSLRANALSQARCLFAEPSEAFTYRVGLYWKQTRKHGRTGLDRHASKPRR